jgi:hypothetical protein
MRGLGSQQSHRRSVQGFSRGLMSSARPLACGDFGTGALIWFSCRQLNADVLSAARLSLTSPPYSSTGFIRRIGKRSSNSRVKMRATLLATSSFTTSAPRLTSPSKLT